MYDWYTQDYQESQFDFDNHITQLFEEVHRCNMDYLTNHECHEQQRKFRMLLHMVSQLRDFHCCFTDIGFSSNKLNWEILLIE